MAKVAPSPCPRCRSDNTIRTASEERFDYWHCYACGKTFEIERLRATPAQRAGDTRREDPR